MNKSSAFLACFLVYTLIHEAIFHFILYLIQILYIQPNHCQNQLCQAVAKIITYAISKFQLLYVPKFALVKYVSEGIFR